MTSAPKPEASFGAHLRRIRYRLSRNYGELTQEQFAKRFALSLGAVKDAEQGRVEPNPAFRVLLAAIDLDSALIDRAVLLSNERLRAEKEGRR